MSDEHRGTYPPLNTLKRIADDIWVVDGPIIRFGMRWPKMPFPTRMTVIRLADRHLFIHSPTPLTPALKAEIANIGQPRWIIGPNRIHYWWIPEWQAAFPGAGIYLAPRIAEQAKGRIDFAYQEMTTETGYPWDGTIATLPVAGSYMTEVEFFHRPSRTLVLTDFIENFEPDKLGGRLTRWLTWLGGVQDPDGGMPRDMRLTFSKASLRAAVEKMIGWKPERIVLAHGRWYDKDGTHELQRAFRSVLNDGLAN